MRFKSSIEFTYYKGMKFSLKAITVLILVLFSFAGCEKPIEPDFSFSPELPKAGQKVTFTNLTVGGEHWNWSFGDDSKSILKNPVYTYKKPGKYDITLRADSNDNYITTKTIIIYDTIPSIYLANDTVGYYQSVTLQVLAYNPFGYAVTYEWSFSVNAQGDDIVSGKSSKATPVVFFTKKAVEENIALKITVGDSVFNVTKKIFVKDVPSRSMLMAGTDGKIYRQRMYLNGLEAPFATSLSSGGGHPLNIQTSGDYLYLFNAGNELSTDIAVLESKTGSGNIRKVNMLNSQTIELIHNRNVSAIHGFYHGWVNNGNIYWTDFADFVYRLADNNQVVGSFNWKGNSNDQATVPYYLLKPDRVGYFGNGLNFGQKNGGIYFYDQVYFWAKGGSGKGIYRFTPADIRTANVVSGQGVSPSLGAILTDYAIHAFRIDHINQKIYFSVTSPAEKTGLWVANLTGTNPVRIDDSPVNNPAIYISSIIIDNVSNRVYWSYLAPIGLTEAHFQMNPHHRSGVKYVRLAKSFTVDKNIQYMPGNIAAHGIAIDETPR